MVENTVSRGSRRGSESSDKFPWEKLDPRERTQRPHRKPGRKTSQMRSPGIVQKKRAKKSLPAQRVRE